MNISTVYTNIKDIFQYWMRLHFANNIVLSSFYVPQDGSNESGSSAEVCPKTHESKLFDKKISGTMVNHQKCYVILNVHNVT